MNEWPFPGLKPRTYRVIYLDPAWRFKGGKGPKSRNVERHYRTMTDADIAALPVRQLAHPDGAWLFMWTTGPKLADAFKMLAAWRARYSGMGFVWIKTHKRFGHGGAVPLFFPRDAWHVGPGYTTRKNAEFCLLAKFGRPKRISKSVREVIISPLREHSRKPDETIERLQAFAAGPYCELFSRCARPGWDSWGDQINKFSDIGGMAA